MKIIRDCIHGNIILSDFEVRIIDTPEFQRLRRIKQLGFAYLVYPSAMHTRFEHSLGVLQTATKIGMQVDLHKEDLELIRVSALLHDIAHGPFSHVSDDIFEKHLGFGHERLLKLVLEDSELGDVLSEAFSKNEVFEVLHGQKPPLSYIIAGDVDADRMDFLVRDSHYTGVAYGIIDLERLICTLRIVNEKLVSEDISAVEAMLVARFMMYPSVYGHHVSRIATCMFRKAIDRIINEGIIKPEDLLKLDDNTIFTYLTKDRFSNEIAKRLLERKLFKRAFYHGKDLFHEQCLKKFCEKRNDYRFLSKIEKEIAEEANVPEDYVILDIPGPFYLEESKFPILYNNRLKKICEVSKLVKILIDAQWDHWKIGVYTIKEYVEDVRKVSENILFNLLT